jgi:hypothetical protein
MNQRNTKCAKRTQNVSQISQISVKYSNWQLDINFPFSNLRPCKNYQNWNFWLENKPSGNPARFSTINQKLFHFLKAYRSVSTKDGNVLLQIEIGTRDVEHCIPSIEHFVLSNSCQIFEFDTEHLVDF